MRAVIAVAIVLAMVLPAFARGQASPDVWRNFVRKVEVGSDLIVRLQDGARFRATLVGVTDEGILLQPRTRLAVPVQTVPFTGIVSLERRSPGGIGAGKAAAIGIAAGAGAFFTMLLIALAVVAD